MKKQLLFIFILTICVYCLGFSNDKPKAVATKSMILSGKIVDLKSNESLAGVKITCASCEKTIYTDLNGNFFVYLEVRSVENLTLEISQIGYFTKILDYKAVQASSGKLIINLDSE